MNTLLFVLVVAAAGEASDPSVMLNAKAQKMLQRGRLPEAARTFARAAELAPNELAAAMFLRNQALTVLRMDDADAARQLAGHALALIEHAAGPQDRHLTPVLNTLAEVAIAERRYDEAAELLDRAIAIGESAGAHFTMAVRNRAVVAKLLARDTVNVARAR